MNPGSRRDSQGRGPAGPHLPHTLSITRVIITALAAFLAVGAGSRAATIPLFNGVDFAGWHSWLVDSGRQDPRHVFTVTNRTIRISGDGLGYLAADREFGEMRLEVEWRWGTTNTRWGDRIGKARDSGIFLHACGPDGNSDDGLGAFMAAIECNVFQGACGDILLIRGNDGQGSPILPRLIGEVAAGRDPEGWFTWKRHGRQQPIERWGRLNNARKSPAWRDVTDFRGPRDAESPAGQWNLMVCEWRGDRLRIRLNGILVNEARQLFPSRGRILLQCEGSEIFFRRITVQ